MDSLEHTGRVCRCAQVDVLCTKLFQDLGECLHICFVHGLSCVRGELGRQLPA